MRRESSLDQPRISDFLSWSWFHLFILFFLAVSLGCQNNNDGLAPGAECLRKAPGPGDRGYLISGERLLEFITQSPVIKSIIKAGLGVDAERNVDVYKIVYQTVDWTGSLRRASGALYLPEGRSSGGFPLLSIQHGTIARAADAPSIAHFSSLEGQFATAAASIGYVVCMPDYLGLGESTDVFHPYLHTNSAEAVIDMIRASRTYCSSNGIILNCQIFLAGYSEGGYVTMATHRALETRFSDEFTVTAAAPMAGPYDLLLTAMNILSKDSYPSPSLIAYLAEAYRSVYRRDEWINIFQSPYIERIPDLFDGRFSPSDIDGQLTNMIDELLNPNFLSAFRGDGEQELKGAFTENSLINDSWIPRAPIRVYHGDADMIVPYANATAAEKRLAERGANVDLIRIPGGNHSTSVLPSARGTVEWFNSLKR